MARAKDYTAMALRLAEDAQKNLFHLRRGVRVLRGGYLCVYDNNPVATDPGARQRIFGVFREELSKRGFYEFAYVGWPPEGVDPGYTVVLLLRGHKCDAELVRRLLDTAVEEVVRRGY